MPAINYGIHKRILICARDDVGVTLAKGSGLGLEGMTSSDICSLSNGTDTPRSVVKLCRDYTGYRVVLHSAEAQR